MTMAMVGSEKKNSTAVHVEASGNVGLSVDLRQTLLKSTVWTPWTGTNLKLPFVTVSFSNDRTFRRAMSSLSDQAGSTVLVTDGSDFGRAMSRPRLTALAETLRRQRFVVVIATSFTRTCQECLKEQGILPLTFGDWRDFEKLRSDSVIVISIGDLFTCPSCNTTLVFGVDRRHGTYCFGAGLRHTLKQEECGWFLAGSKRQALLKMG